MILKKNNMKFLRQIVTQFFYYQIDQLITYFVPNFSFCSDATYASLTHSVQMRNSTILHMSKATESLDRNGEDLD